MSAAEGVAALQADAELLEAVAEIDHFLSTRGALSWDWDAWHVVKAAALGDVR